MPVVLCWICIRASCKSMDSFLIFSKCFKKSFKYFWVHHLPFLESALDFWLCETSFLTTATYHSWKSVFVNFNFSKHNILWIIQWLEKVPDKFSFWTVQQIDFKLPIYIIYHVLIFIIMLLEISLFVQCASASPSIFRHWL